MSKQNGMTLIELMIVLVIAGILASIALPMYRDYVIRGKLTDAQATLSGTRTKLEQYYQDNRTYPASCGGTAANIPTFNLPSASQYFAYTCSAGDTAGQTFVLTATGASGGDTAGFIYTINEQGVRATTGVPSNGWTVKTDCWVIKKPNGC